jgi:phospholipid transport system substrate-binding protein
MMNNRCLFLITSLLVFLTLGIASSWAGEPTQQIKQTTDKILAILSNPSLKGPAQAEERRKVIGETVDERFDWEEMSRRSLARHWAARTPEEKKEFMGLFRDLLARTYLNKVDDYSGETVTYEGDTIDGNYASVKVKIVTSKGEEIPVEYRVMKRQTNWFVYDITIEGVSFVNNYRSQFNSILSKSPYSELVKKLKDKSSFVEKK